MKIRPIETRVAVKFVPPEEQSAGGIIIPDMAQDRPSKGVVVAVGPGTNDHEMVVKKGDIVMFGQYAGGIITVDNEDFLIMKEEDILVVIEDG